MPKVMKICKACGKEYEACHTPNPGVFRWRDIACSVECAQKYIHDVMVARGEIIEEQDNVSDKECTSYINTNQNEEVKVQKPRENAETAIKDGNGSFTAKTGKMKKK